MDLELARDAGRPVEEEEKGLTLAARRDNVLQGPLQQPDLADEAVRSTYLRDLARAQLGEETGNQEESVSRTADAFIVLPPVSPTAMLLDYQAELAREVISLCEQPEPGNIGLVALPTGAGKTRTAVCAVLELVSTSRARTILWIAPSRELLEQAIGTFQALWPMAGSRNVSLQLMRSHVSKSYPLAQGAAVYFSTPQMLYQRFLAKQASLPAWDLVIFDEAHLAEAPTFRDALTLAREQRDSVAPCFGLSATPGRSDERSTSSLISLFGRRLITSALLGKDVFAALRKQGVLAKVDFRTIPTHSDETHKPDPETDVGRFRATISLCEALSKSSGSTMVFAASVRHAVALTVSLRHKGVAAAWVSGAMSTTERERTLKAFEAGAFRVLLNKTLLATGYDCPAISNVVLTAPVKSPVLFEQMVGRASRGPRVGGNAKATVWYFEDHIKWHGKPSSYQRYALSGWL